jgi:hypothetical protein
VDIRESSSEAGGCGRMIIRIEGVKRIATELDCEKKT